MIYPANFEHKSGFDIIRQMISQSCLSTLGQTFAAKMRFSSSFEVVTRYINQTEEFRQLLLHDAPFPSQDYFDLTVEFERLHTDGTYLEPEQLFELKLSLHTINLVLDYLIKKKERYSVLSELTGTLQPDYHLLQNIDRIISDKGEINDKASDELHKIRRDLQSKISSVERKVMQSLSAAKKEGWLTGDTEITIRNGRLVIPVPASYKRKLKGYIHDESATGQTVYIEPAEAFEINNEVRELEIAERREIVRILIEFADMLRPQLLKLIDAYRFLGLIDFIRAKAQVAIRINAVKPLLNNKPIVEWFHAVHPLLYLSHSAQRKEVVPLDMNLNEKERILIISGPNAGGKSVCLKTVGLLQYMLQCGMLIPVRETSETGFFEHIFIDIGDEQSLENDLSTYSSHLLNIKNLLAFANKSTLFLIDEFGSGTEPQMGGAIAEAVLMELSHKKAFGVVTTHYSNLKMLAGKANGIVNGAMLFDQQKMRPLYQLKTGKPGSSFAFEIARNIGFPEKILQNAAQKTGTAQFDYEQKLNELETEKEQIDKERKRLNTTDTFLSEIVQKYQSLHDDLEKKKKEIIGNAREEARRLLAESNRIIEKTIKEIKENQAEREVTLKAREEIRKFAKKVEKIENVVIPEVPDKSRKKKMEAPVIPSENAEDLQIDNTPIQPGDFVCITSQGIIGEVLEISGDEAYVAFENFKMKTPVERLEKAIPGEKPGKPSPRRTPGIDILKKATEFKLQIDLRGKRADEALDIVQKYIDEAILLDVFEVSILHGKGNGILRHLIREYLAKVKEVKQFHDERLENGGHGITVVKFR